MNDKVDNPGIETVEQLHDLPAGTILLDKDGDAWKSEGLGVWVVTGAESDSYYGFDASSVLEYRPLKILYTPEEGSNER